tara:strand:+ start:7712 stop:8689 length:978 start_codon:yes stop_codon:yes gene_type:complete
MKCAITGGYGFIGSNLVNYLYENTDDEIIIIDNFTYAADKQNISPEIQKSSRVNTLYNDIGKISDSDTDLHKALKDCDVIYHLAAESHVDNSITGPGVFVDTNIRGTFNLLELARNYDIKFVHISTDEVYGALQAHDDPFTENTNLDPSSVYSASKASSDLLVKAYGTTYGVDTVITRCVNNYGPRQHVEKLLPKVITNTLRGKEIPVYGKGLNIREWIHVDDHCAGILAASTADAEDKVFNIGSGVEVSNIELVNMVLDIIGESAILIKYVEDRLGHDFRYAMNSDKLRNATGWKPTYDTENFINGLELTVKWYRAKAEDDLRG